MIGPTNNNRAADLTALAVRASNLKAGVEGTTEVAAKAGASKEAAVAPAGQTEGSDRGPAVMTDERTLQLARAIARQQAESDARTGGGSMAPPRGASAARQEMLESALSAQSAMQDMYEGLKETSRLYSETGKVFTVQKDGTYELGGDTLDPWGGAEGYMKDVQQRIDAMPRLLREQAENISGI